MEFKILNFEKHMLNEVLQIERDCFSSPWSKEQFMSLEGDERTVFIVASVNKIIAGFAMLYLVSESASADLLNIAVDINHRNKGIAKAMLEYCFEICKSRSLTEIYLEVRESNQNAMKLYKGKGFFPIALRKNYYHNPTENAVVMKRCETNLPEASLSSAE